MTLEDVYKDYMEDAKNSDEIAFSGRTVLMVTALKASKDKYAIVERIENPQEYWVTTLVANGASSVLRRIMSKFPLSLDEVKRVLWGCRED